MNNRLMFSSEYQAWATPRDLFRKLNKQYKFNLDPCASEDTAVCKKYFTKEEDGLKQSWKGKRAFINPPFKEVGKWVQKAHEEITKGGCKLAVLLVASRTDTKWFHNFVYDVSSGKAYKGVQFTFLMGRLTFGTDEYWKWVWKKKKINGKQNKLYRTQKRNPAPFPSLLITMKGK